MSDLTPMFRQYNRIKESHRDCIVMFRMGDFYEMFYDDALKAAEALDITLTSRGRGTAAEAPMCGVPHHAAEAYIARLVRRGFRVAICDQVEDARKAKGIVRREVTRIVSPGTVSRSDQLDAAMPNFLCSLFPDRAGFGAALIDLSTGEFRVAEHLGPEAGDQLRAQLATSAPAEILVPEGASIRDTLPAVLVDRVLVNERPGWEFSLDSGRRELTGQFRVAGLEGFGLGNRPLAIRAAGAALQYLRESQKSSLPHLRAPRLVRSADTLVLDPATLRNLEITANLQDGRRHGSLLHHLDRTATAGGARRLRDWLLRPLLDCDRIAARLDAVAELVDDAGRRAALREHLRRSDDLERLLARAGLGNASVRDLAALRTTLRRLPEIRATVETAAAPLLARCRDGVDPLDDLRGLLEQSLVDEPPAKLGDGNVIRPGYSPELDELRDIRSSGKEYLVRLEARERERTGVASLKVRYNKVFGYYIEVSKANLHLVPDDYTRKQTLTNAERFILPELKEYEAKVLTAEERIAALEADLFARLRGAITERGERILCTADAVADLDTLAALAEVAERQRWVRPLLHDDRRLTIVGGRHPVLEAIGEAMDFIPNDAAIDPDDSQILILTGPNMGGKSTYLRQVALMTLLAQMGSFVPADRAEIGIVDRIFSRIGASDNLLLGQSTFLSEMLEVANILNNATDRSLILLDEVGRGTSTFDGLSLAWAVVEQLHNEPRLAAKTLFATHYHELTTLAETMPRVRNLTMAVREKEDGVVFLHRVVPGSSDRSYGIHVAELAGVPDGVIRRARQILEELEAHSTGTARSANHRRAAIGQPGGPEQLRLDLDEKRGEKVRRALLEIEPEQITPLEAIRILAELREKAEG